MARKSKIESHPRFQEIIEAVINNRMTGREASKTLGTTEPNFSQYMSRHYPKHKPKKKKTVKRRAQSSIALDKKGDPGLNILLSAHDSNVEWGTIGWKRAIQRLVDILETDDDLTLDQTIKLTRALADILKFQFSHNVPDIPQETVKIDEEMAKEVIDEVMKDHDEWCPYRSGFIKEKDREQSKSRLESPEPPLVE